MEQIIEKDGHSQVQDPARFNRYIFQHNYQLYLLLVLLDEWFQESRDLDRRGGALEVVVYFPKHTKRMVSEYCKDFGVDALEKDLGFDRNGRHSQWLEV